MKKNLRMFSVVFFLALQWIAYGQDKTINGKVTDDTNLPLPGVSVIISGTKSGTITDANGQYSLSVPSDSKALVFSFIGFKTQTVDIAGRTVINLKLEPEVLGINEVVVVGYGAMKKTDISSASISVSEEKIKGSVITNLDQALQGRAAGVTSTMTSGAPGSSVSIRVRGQSTVNAGAEPLYVIDGVIVQGGGKSGADFGLGDKLGNGSVSAISPLSAINPSDIASMEILKDASATAIYGAQGANGVILITTKRGKAGDAKFSYEGLYGMMRQYQRIDMMNLREFAEYSNSVAAESNSLDSREEFNDPSLLGVGTNWQNAIFQQAMMKQHQVTASGGTDAVQYLVSGGYMDQEGTIIGTDFNRFTFKVNLDAQLKKWMKLGVSANFSKTNENLGLAEGTNGLVNYSLLTPPDIPVYDINGDYASVVREGYTRINPIAATLDEELTLERQKVYGNIFADITPIKDLVWHAEVGYDIGGSRGEVFMPAVTYGNWSRAINENSVQRNNNDYIQLKNYLTYTGKYGDHGYTLMLGQEAWESNYEYQSIYAQNLPDNNVHNPSLGEDPVISYGFGSSSMSSFFGRVFYNYQSRFNASYVYRRDGSSNFGPKNRWADFHSVSASWRFTEEAFMEGMKDVLSNGKIRLGWGQTGNSNIGGYKWGASISRMPTGFGMGYRQSNIANPYIQWETQEQYNIGLDLGFLKDRINLTMELYDKTSEDMLMPLQLPSYMGTRGNQSSALASPMGNYGTMNNKGWEISLNTRNFVGAFEWDTDLQLSANKNKLVALDGTANAHLEGYGQWSDVVSVTNVGESLYNFYGYKVVGVYKDLADLQNSPKPAKYPSDGVTFDRYNTVWVGDLKFEDLSGPNGKPDGVINEYDRTNIGSPMPKITFGLTNTFRYKNFDLSLFLQGTYGNKILNYSAINLSNMKSVWDNQLQTVTDRAVMEPIDPSITYPANGEYAWFDDITNVQVSNPDTKTPRAIANDPNDNDRISDRYIEDGSYLRIKNLMFGYTLPQNVVSKLHVSNLKVYINIQNLYTFTKYSGYDPEVGVSTLSSNVYGLDNGRYPSPQIYTFGVNLAF